MFNLKNILFIASLIVTSGVANAAPLACPVDHFSNPEGGVSSCRPCPTGTSTNGNVNQPYCGFPADGYVVFADFDWPVKKGAPPYQASAWGPATIACPAAAKILWEFGWIQQAKLRNDSFARANRVANASSQYAYGANCQILLTNPNTRDGSGGPWIEMPKLYYNYKNPEYPSFWVGQGGVTKNPSRP